MMIAMSEQETIGVLEVYEDVTMREARLDDAALVWQAIYDHRDYLKTWLPFVLRLHTVEDEEAFLREVLAVPFEERNLVMVIEKKGVFCGLIGFVTTDRVNHRTEIGYWLLPEFQGQGIMTRCVRCLCEWAVQYRGHGNVFRSVVLSGTYPVMRFRNAWDFVGKESNGPEN